jgi:hypothetical protein
MVKHHLDRRADAIIASGVGTDADELLTTIETARWLGVSPQFLEIGRNKKYGPPFVRVAPQIVRYRRGDVNAWLRERTFASTAGYSAR